MFLSVFTYTVIPQLRQHCKINLHEKLLIIIIVKKMLCVYQIPGTLEDKFKREKSSAIVSANHHNSS